MTTRDDILQGIRDWFATAIDAIPAVGTTGIDPTASNQIISAELKGPRPGLPYLTVKVSVADQGVGVDEERYAIDPDDLGGPSLWKVKGERAAVIDLQAHDAQGATTAAGWLEDAVLRLMRPDVVAVVDAAGLTVINLGEVLDISTLLDSEIERRHLRTIDVRYAVRDSGPGLPELVTVEATITLERYDDHPDPLTVDIVVTP